MIAIVDHANGNRRSVRDDIAEEYVACIKCKGMGDGYRCTGQLGNFLYDGWQINSYASFRCDACFGKGIWPERSTVTRHDDQAATGGK